MSNSDNLESVYLAFARRVLADIVTWLDTGEIPPRTHATLRFQDNGIAWDQEEHVFYWPVIKEHYGDELFGTPEATEAARVHLLGGVLEPPKLSNAEGKSIIAPTFDQMRGFLVIELLHPLIGLIERHSTMNVTDDQILESYHAARTLWTARAFEHRILVPVHQLKSDVDRLELRPGLSLSPFLPSEKTATWMMGFIPFAGPGVWDYQACKYKLFHAETLERGRKPDHTAIREDIYNFISALRLLKPGQVGTLGIFAGTEGERAQSYSSPIPELEVQGFGTSYELTSDECASVVAFFQRLRQCMNNGFHKGLDAALRRFNLSYARSLPEDKIIDLTVALESTLLFGVDAELQYRLSLRGAP